MDGSYAVKVYQFKLKNMRKVNNQHECSFRFTAEGNMMGGKEEQLAEDSLNKEHGQVHDVEPVGRKRIRLARLDMMRTMRTVSGDLQHIQGKEKQPQPKDFLSIDSMDNKKTNVPQQRG